MSKTRVKVFILSPASTAGKRASLLLHGRGKLARREKPVPIGDVFTFLSGLYFRGKLAYARYYAAPKHGWPGCYIISSNAGLVLPEEDVSVVQLVRFSQTPIDEDEPLYSEPLRQALGRLGKRLPHDAQIVFLGSIATRKYRAILSEVLGGRLYYPACFEGRGDLSRGSVLLQSVKSGRELEYRPLEGL